MAYLAIASLFVFANWRTTQGWS